MHESKRATPADPQTPPPPGPLGLPKTSEMSPGVTVREAYPKGGQISSLTYLMSSHPKGMHSLIQRVPRQSQQDQSEAPPGRNTHCQPHQNKGIQNCFHTQHALQKSPFHPEVPKDTFYTHWHSQGGLFFLPTPNHAASQLGPSSA